LVDIKEFIVEIVDCTHCYLYSSIRLCLFQATSDDGRGLCTHAVYRC